MNSDKRNYIILVVDDSPGTREILQRNLSAQGYVTHTSPDVAGAVSILDENDIDLVITDLKMPGESGIDLVRHVRENCPDSMIMMITGYPSIPGAVEAVKSGVQEYLSKPFTDDELLAAVQSVLGKLQRRRDMHQAASPDSAPTTHGLVGNSSVMKTVYKTIDKAAATTATTLVTGESGTGKELVARAIHYTGDRATSSFVPVNCGAIPTDLLESELFGYMKGSFTNANESRAGFFHAADGGTVFLDEISEASPHMQLKLLRVLEDGHVYMIGSREPQKVDVRVVAATNRSLSELVEKGVFREDLFYRLNVINIDIPPLRERGKDTILLCRYFAEKFSKERGRTSPSFSDNALAALQDYYWPGNVRELKNVIQRLIIMTDSDNVDITDLPNLMRFSALRNPRPPRTLAEVQQEHIRTVMASVSNNKTRAAEILGIDRKTLNNKLAKHI